MSEFVSERAHPSATAAGTCLLCHTVATEVTRFALDAGAYWTCGRCGQLWDATRLAASAAYSKAMALNPPETRPSFRVVTYN